MDLIEHDDSETDTTSMVQPRQLSAQDAKSALLELIDGVGWRVSGGSFSLSYSMPNLSFSFSYWDKVNIVDNDMVKEEFDVVYHVDDNTSSHNDLTDRGEVDALLNDSDENNDPSASNESKNNDSTSVKQYSPDVISPENSSIQGSDINVDVDDSNALNKQGNQNVDEVPKLASSSGSNKNQGSKNLSGGMIALIACLGLLTVGSVLFLSLYKLGLLPNSLSAQSSSPSHLDLHSTDADASSYSSELGV